MYRVQTWKLGKWVTASETNYPAAMSIMARADQVDQLHRRIVDVAGKVVAVGKHQPCESAARAATCGNIVPSFYQACSLEWAHIKAGTSRDCAVDGAEKIALRGAHSAVIFQCVPETLIQLTPTLTQIDLRQPA